MFILALCEEPSILNLILFMKSLLEMIGVMAPIILIVMVTIDLVKIVIDSSDKTIKDMMKSTRNRIVAAMLIFFVPTLVNVLMNQIEQKNVVATACWTNANTETIAKYKKIKDAKRLAEQKEKQEKIAANNKKREEEDEERKKKIVKSSDIGSQIIKTVEANVNNNHAKYTSWFGIDVDRVGWCAIFASWVTAHTSITGNGSDCTNTGKEGSDKCVNNVHTSVVSFEVADHAKERAEKNLFYHSKYFVRKFGTYKDGNQAYTPRPGDEIFFARNWPYLGDPTNAVERLSHIAFVKEVKNNVVYYIGGNQGGQGRRYNKVTIQHIDIDSEEIGGYGTWSKN